MSKIRRTALDAESSIWIIVGNADPTVTPGVNATVGSIYVRRTGGSGRTLFEKYGPGPTAWEPLGLSIASSLVAGITPESIGAALAIHATQHHTGGSDPLAAADIGAAPTVHTHALADIIGLIVGSKLDPALIPSLAIEDTVIVASQAAMLAATAQKGDVAIRTDENETYILQGADPTVLSNWVKLLHPLAGVESVNGLTGAVTLPPLAPAAHAASHGVTGADPISPAILGVYTSAQIDALIAAIRVDPSYALEALSTGDATTPELIFAGPGNDVVSALIPLT